MTVPPAFSTASTAPADAPVETTLLEKIKAHAGLIVLGLVVAFFAWKTFRK